MGDKFYAVKNGEKPGIYVGWNECEKQVKGFPNAVFKGFEVESEAYDFMKNEEKSSSLIKEPTQQVDVQLYVDGSWNENKKQYGWGFVLVVDGQSVSSDCGMGNNIKYLSQRQIGGEVVAVLQGLSRAIYRQYNHVEVVYDFSGIEMWATGKWRAKTDIARAFLHFLGKYNEEIQISFKKVKSHSGDKYNAMADGLAKKGANK